VVSGNYACVTTGIRNGGGLIIINVSNPSSPTLVGSLTLDGSQRGGLTVAGNYAYTGRDTWGCI
jgi:hypothetical protein